MVYDPESDPLNPYYAVLGEPLSVAAQQFYNQLTHRGQDPKKIYSSLFPNQGENIPDVHVLIDEIRQKLGETALITNWHGLISRRAQIEKRRP